MAPKKKPAKKVVKAKKAAPAKKRPLKTKAKPKTKAKTVAATKKVVKKAVKKPATRKVAKKAVKTVAKKPVRKVAKKVTKKVVKKSTAKKVTKKALPKLSLAKKMYTKSELYRVIGSHVGITKRQVSDVFDVLSEVVHNHLRSGAVGVLKLEGLLKIEKVRKPAKKERKGVNPFTGETMVFKAKPAHNIIKVRALKKLKEMVK